MNREEYTMQDRATKLAELIQQIHDGVDPNEIRAEFVRSFEGVSTDEIAEAEQILIAEGMPVSEIQHLCDFHASLVAGQVTDEAWGMEAGHPLTIFRAENDAIAELIDNSLEPALSSLRDGEERFAELAELLRQLAKIDRHYARKGG